LFFVTVLVHVPVNIEFLVVKLHGFLVYGYRFAVNGYVSRPTSEYLASKFFLSFVSGKI